VLVMESFGCAFGRAVPESVADNAIPSYLRVRLGRVARGRPPRRNEGGTHSVTGLDDAVTRAERPAC